MTSSIDNSPPAPTERAVMWHLIGFVLLATWMFGGNIYWARLPLCLWGTLGCGLTIVCLVNAGERRRRYLWWLLPFALLNALIVASTFNPSFIEFSYYEWESLRPAPHAVHFPSSARPRTTLSDLWLYDGLYLAAFNLIVGVRRRRTLRVIGYALVINAAVLSVFGTIQKLFGADIYFGLEHSPNPAFFATFIYHNHWGTFAMLMSALGLGLAAHQLSHGSHRDLWHSPAGVLLAVVLLLAASIPLSTSRSTTVAEMVIGLVALVYALRRATRRSGQNPLTRLRNAVLLSLGAVAAAAAIYGLAKPTIDRRIDDTVVQLKREHHYAFIPELQVFYLDARKQLYLDTLTMAAAKPWFGWGFGCYGMVFKRYDTQTSQASRYARFFDDAHSDWLESLAEIGAVGTALVLALIAIPLAAIRRRWFRHAVTGFPVFGAGLLVLYSAFEFPFANPAVVLCFWTVLFLGVRHEMITARNHSDAKT